MSPAGTKKTAVHACVQTDGFEYRWGEARVRASERRERREQGSYVIDLRKGSFGCLFLCIITFLEEMNIGNRLQRVLSYSYQRNCVIMI